MISGFGYGPFHFQFTPVEKWKKLINFYQSNKDTRSILKSYIKKNPELMIIPFQK